MLWKERVLFVKKRAIGRRGEIDRARKTWKKGEMEKNRERQETRWFRVKDCGGSKGRDMKRSKSI